MDAKWEAAIDLTLRRLVYGSLAGGAAGLVLFRASPAAPRARPLASPRLASLADRSIARSPSHFPSPPPPSASVHPSGGGGARASSLAFGAGAALGSAYTGASPRRPSSSVSVHLARSLSLLLPSRRRFADAPRALLPRGLRRLLAAVREPRVPEAPARAQVSTTSRENSGAMTASHSTCKPSRAYLSIVRARRFASVASVLNPPSSSSTALLPRAPA
jgi:hypothetical protein